jgi:hypothetical protein
MGIRLTPIKSDVREAAKLVVAVDAMDPEPANVIISTEVLAPKNVNAAVTSEMSSWRMAKWHAVLSL